MDIYQLLSQNITAVIGLVGVVAGAILTSIPIILLQLLQRRWQVQDETMQWRRNRLLTKLSVAQDWLDDVLRFTDVLEEWLSEHKHLSPSEYAEAAKNDLGEAEKVYRKSEAIMFSRIMSIGDDELLKLIVYLRGSRSLFFESLNTHDENKITMTSFAVQAAAAQIAQRIEFLIEKASPIGKTKRNKINLNSLWEKIKLKKKQSQKPPA